jgi:GT2 family glycosyltransferase
MCKISVIVPTCDRPDRLAACLSRLAPGRQSFPADDYEVIVTNDGDDVCRDVIARDFPWAIYVEAPRQGPAANRNFGVRRATGEWLAFIDDDCVPSRGWLGEIWAVAGAGTHDLLEGWVDASGSIWHPLDERIENRDGNAFWSCNLAARRTVFEKSGGFDEDFPEPAFEDMELAQRLKKLGARTAFVPGARVEHPTRRLTLAQLWRRRMTLRWYVLYLQKTSTRGPLSVAGLLCANLARGLRKHLRGFDSNHWQRSLFLPLWELLTFPIILPCVMFWDWEFRRAARAPRAVRARLRTAL